jgi:hypothetical protein
MGLLAGAGGVLLETFLAACLYLFEPPVRSFIVDHLVYFFVSLLVMFIVAFGLSIGFAAAIQIRGGKAD